MNKRIIRKIVPGFLVSWYHFFWAFLSALFFGFPAYKIKIIGITGTNGKTTTANLLSDILETAGKKTAVASSIRFKVADKEAENKLKMTMPGRGYLQRFLKKAVKAKCDYAIIEATSEGVLQHRHKFLNFQIMVFTNLTPEHIERHGSFENYKKAKGEYFKHCGKTHIINIDDESAAYFLSFPAKKKIAFSTLKQSNFSAEHIQEENNTTLFSLNGLRFSLPLIGRFNVYNALAAIAASTACGVSLETCGKALFEANKVSGRMEEVIKEPFRVIVDYAFTPNALTQVYQTLKQNLSGKLICVLGAAGGGRDKWKRPILGKIAGQYCDEIIITNEDPYDENPLDILNQVAEGVDLARLGSEKIMDRREAIHKALQKAQANDVVIITGKGSEPWIVTKNNQKIPWDDRKVVKEEMAKIGR